MRAETAFFGGRTFTRKRVCPEGVNESPDEPKASVLRRHATGGRKPAQPRARDAVLHLLTPHAGERAHLSGADKSSVSANPHRAAKAAARRWNAVVALKGASTFIAVPNGRVWRHDGGNVGLAISGSGDVLAGLIAGLAARGASLEQAAAWGVALHARAGEQLAVRFGPLGYLARELPAAIPALMHALAVPAALALTVAPG